MSRPAISSERLTEHITLSECHPDSECRTVNWWLYDTRAGYNIGMREKSRDAAFVGAIDYWADRATRAEKELSDIQSRVSAFVGQFIESDDS